MSKMQKIIGMKQALRILESRQHRTAYENLQYLSFLIKVEERNSLQKETKIEYLRKESGFSFHDCAKALVESDGDYYQALKYLNYTKFTKMMDSHWRDND